MAAHMQQQRVRLSPDTLACIKVIAGSGALTPRTRLAGVLTLIHGWAAADGQDEIDPMTVAIPGEQWEEVCRALVAAVVNPIDAVNLGMEFMNKGPATFDD